MCMILVAKFVSGSSPSENLDDSKFLLLKVYLILAGTMDRDNQKHQPLLMAT